MIVWKKINDFIKQSKNVARGEEKISVLVHKAITECSEHLVVTHVFPCLFAVWHPCCNEDFAICCIAFVCITFFYMTLLLKMMWCTFNTSISHTQLMMLTKISHCQYCILNTSLHINILMSFTVDHELQSIHRNHSYLLLTWKKWINLLWPSVQHLQHAA